MSKPHLCKRCKTGKVLPETWRQSGRLCPSCAEIIKAEIVAYAETQLPELERIARMLRTMGRRN